MKDTYNTSLIGVSQEELSKAALAIYNERGYEGKTITATSGEIAGMGHDVYQPPHTFQIVIESQDEFDPTGEGFCDLYFYGKPKTEADWNHPDILPLWDRPRPADEPVTDEEWTAFLRGEILIRVVGITVDHHDGRVREYYGEQID